MSAPLFLVEQTFFIPGVEKNHVVETSARTAVLNKPVAECIKPGAGNFSYSGVHDHGVMEQFKIGGPLADLIGAVEDAKQSSNKFLTELIEKEKSEAAAAADIDERESNKKPRLE